MNILMIGCGKVGLTLVKQLLAENHSVSVIDSNPDVVTEVNNSLDVIAYLGNGASFSVQKEAGVENADIVIAVTGSDELNLLCCLIAKKAGDCKTIARVRNPEYLSELPFLRETLDLALTINPDQASAKEISRILRRSYVKDINSFAKGRVEIITIEVPSGSVLCDLPVYQLHDKVHLDVLICAVVRDGQCYIPSGAFVLKEGDIISYVASTQQSIQFIKKIGIKQTTVRNCMIIGGSKIAYYLAEQMTSHGVSVKIVEKDRTRCEQLSQSLPKAEIICGDGTDERLLVEEGIDSVDSFITLTNMDEENILLSMFAANRSNAKVITKINKISYDHIVESLDVGTVINPKNTTSELILQYVRARQNSVGSNVETLYKLIEDKVEAIEFVIREESGLTRTTLAELGVGQMLIDNMLIAGIIRGGKFILPKGTDQLTVGDTVIVVTSHLGLTDIKEILKG